MEEIIKLTKPFPYSKELLQIKDILLQGNDEIRLVGGCVRDFLLDRKINDIDLATKHRPEDVTYLLKKQNITVIPTGIKHGTVTAVMDGKHFEITTLRTDLKCDGRHAKVKFGESYEVDAKRRDFTINAMYIDFDNKVYDYFDGYSDAKNGLIKFIGNPKERITEDYLRILRMFRFYCYYGKKIDTESINSCEEQKEGIMTLSGERISAELFKILRAKNPAGVLRTMQSYEILQQIFHKKINLNHVIKLIFLERELEIQTSYIFRFGMLLYNEKKKQIISICEDLRLSNAEKNTLLSYKECIEINHMVSEDTLKELMLDYTQERIMDSLVINILAYPGNIDNYIKNRFHSIQKFIKSYKVPIMPLNGDDLMGIGIPKGERIGKLLRDAKRYWIKSGYEAGKDEILNSVV